MNDNINTRNIEYFVSELVIYKKLNDRVEPRLGYLLVTGGSSSLMCGGK